MQELPQIGEILDETYQIESLLGQGGFGAVYLARQLSMDRPVALKVLVAHAMKVEEMIERFRREVMAVKHLTHPNTIRIYDFRDRSDGLLYYAMEYVKGPNLKTTLTKSGPMSPRRTRHILRQVLKSLSEAHALGIVHRDLKPANIMLADMHGETDFVKVLDFGIAKILDDSADEDADQLTNAGVLVGTLRYMSPEQIAGDGIGPHSDLYALGLIGIEMLTGKSVFAGTGRFEILSQQVSEKPLDIPDVVLQTPLGAWFQKALEKNPTTRFQSADEMREALENLQGLNDELIVEPEQAPADSAGATSDVRSGGGAPGTKLTRRIRPPISESGPISRSEKPQPNTPISDLAEITSGKIEPVESRRAVPVAEHAPTPGAASDISDGKTQVLPVTPGSRSGESSGPWQRPRSESSSGASEKRPSKATLWGVQSAPKPSDHSGPTNARQEPATGETAAPLPSKKSGLVLLLAGFLAMLLVGGAILLIFAGGEEEGAVAQPADDGAVGSGTDEPGREGTGEEDPLLAGTPGAADPESDEDIVEKQPVEEPTVSWVRLVTPDVEARVYDRDEHIGTTPLRLSIQEKRSYVLKAKDRRDTVVELDTDSDEEVIVELEEIPREKPAAEKPTKPRPTTGAGGKEDESDEDDDGWLEIPSSDTKKNEVPIF